MKSNRSNLNVKKIFNEMGERYSKPWQSLAKQRLAEFELNLVDEAVKSCLQSSRKNRLKVLDIGVGLGRVADRLLSYDVDYYGLDLAPKMIEFCKDKYAENKKVKVLKVHDIAKGIPESWGKFDLITAVRVISYTSTWREVICETRERLTRGGRFFFTMPNKYSSTVIPKLLFKYKRVGYDTNWDELSEVLNECHYSEYQIRGRGRILDVFYDWAISRWQANLVFKGEQLFDSLFGDKLLTRMFYITAQK